MKAMQRLYESVALGAAALFSLTTAAKAVEPAPTTEAARNVAVKVVGPFTNYGAAWRHADDPARLSSRREVIYRHRSYWVVQS